MAARRIVNIEGPCEKTGDEYGNTFQEVLERYYAYSFSDLEVLKFEFIINDYWIMLDGHSMVEQILMQRDVDKSVLFSNS